MRHLFIFLFVLIGFESIAQQPTNYTRVAGRYKWTSGYFDSTMHIPSGPTPKLGGGYTGPGALFFNTTDSSVYTWTGTQWTLLRGSIEGEVSAVRNNTGSAITKGSVVYITGSTGTVPTIAKASAKAESTSSVTFGVLAQDLAAGETGYAVLSGRLYGLNTNAYTEGDPVYLDTIAGQFTHTKYQAPLHFVLVGYIVKKSGGNGSLEVKIQNYPELDELHNVRITDPVRNQSILLYDSTNKLWVDTALSAVAPSTNIYNADGTLTGNRTLTSGGYSLTILGGIEEVVGFPSEQISLRLQGSTTTKNPYLSLKNTNASGKDYTLRSMTDGSFDIFNLSNLTSIFKHDWTNNINYFKSASGLTDTNNFYLGFNIVSGLWLTSSKAIGNYAICQSGGSTFVNAPTSGSIGFRINNADKMTLTSAGRLLLGTTTEATYLLDVNGTLRTTDEITLSKASGTALMNVIGGSGVESQVRIGSQTANTRFSLTANGGDFYIGSQPDVGTSTKIFTISRANTNVAIVNNTTTATYANKYSLLELVGTGKGFLPNRMTQSQLRGIAGAVNAVSTVSGGSGYTNGTYNNKTAIVTTAYGTGTVQVSATVVGGVVTTLTIGPIPPYGSGFQIGDIITSIVDLSGGAGFQGKISGVTTPTSLIAYQTDATEGAYIHTSNNGWQRILTTSDSSGNIYTTDGTLTGNRILDASTYTLNFNANASQGIVFHKQRINTLDYYYGFSGKDVPLTSTGNATNYNVAASFNGNVLYLNAGLALAFSMSGTEIMRLTNNNNFIVGNGSSFSDAGYKLDVQGTGRFTGNVRVDNGIRISREGVVTNGYTMIIGDQPALAGATPYYNTLIGNTPYGLSSNKTRNAILGSTWQSTGDGAVGVGNNVYLGGDGAIAFGNGTTALANEFVAGNPNYAITNVYFGNGKIGGDFNTYSSRDGVSYAINGSGGNGTDRIGGNITIAGGKGTGAGTPGDIIFSTATPTTTGTTLQSLTQRWWVKGSTGTLANLSSPNASAALQVDATTQGFLPPRMTGAQAEAISSPAAGLMVYANNGNGTTITSVGWWGYNGTTWVRLK